MLVAQQEYPNSRSPIYQPYSLWALFFCLLDSCWSHLDMQREWDNATKLHHTQLARQGNRDKGVVSGVSQTRFTYHPCNSLIGIPLEICSHSLCLRFHICKMEILITPIPWHFVKIRYVTMYKALAVLPDREISIL
jgi:hypothetical protein